MQAHWEAERKDLRTAIRMEVMQEILDDPTYQVVRTRLSKPCLPCLPLMLRNEHALQGWHTGDFVDQL